MDIICRAKAPCIFHYKKWYLRTTRVYFFILVRQWSWHREYVITSKTVFLCNPIQNKEKLLYIDLCIGLIYFHPFLVNRLYDGTSDASVVVKDQSISQIDPIDLCVLGIEIILHVIIWSFQFHGVSEECQKYRVHHWTYPEIGDSSFRCALWTFKQQLAWKVRARCGISIVPL